MCNKKFHFLKNNFYLALMTLEEAFIDFISADGFKDVAKLKNSEGGKYRVYLARFKSGELKTAAMVELLEANGYEIKANKVGKKKS